MIMWKLRAALFALLKTARPLTVWAYRYTRPTRHHVRSLQKAGIEAIRADMLILAQYNERVRRAKLSLETSNWDTVKTRRLRAKLAV
jgi:hypothetical protein